MTVTAAVGCCGHVRLAALWQDDRGQGRCCGSEVVVPARSMGFWEGGSFIANMIYRLS